jgi:hypothetical protein
MNNGTLFWMIIFGVAALFFFGVAAVVTVKGFGDLKDLLHLTHRGD